MSTARPTQPAAASSPPPSNRVAPDQATPRGTASRSADGHGQDAHRPIPPPAGAATAEGHGQDAHPLPSPTAIASPSAESTLAADDKAYLWHPFTQMAEYA